MSQSLARVLVHLVFSTKGRTPLINASVRPTLHAYMAGTVTNLNCISLCTGGMADHVHALFALPRTQALAEVVEQVKKGSSKWMKRQGVVDFAWQAGYGAFSVSESQAARVVAYIHAQEEHHRSATFQDELRQLLRCHHLAYDERCLWD